jgi:hypothetical protein
VTDKDTRLLFEQYIVSENRKDTLHHLMNSNEEDLLKLQLLIKFNKMFKEIADIRAFVEVNKDKFPSILGKLYSIDTDDIEDDTDRNLMMHIIGLSDDLEYIGHEISSHLGYEV